MAFQGDQTRNRHRRWGGYFFSLAPANSDEGSVTSGIPNKLVDDQTILSEARKVSQRLRASVSEPCHSATSTVPETPNRKDGSQKLVATDRPGG